MTFLDDEDYYEDDPNEYYCNECGKRIYDDSDDEADPDEQPEDKAFFDSEMTPLCKDCWEEQEGYEM